MVLLYTEIETYFEFKSTEWSLGLSEMFLLLEKLQPVVSSARAREIDEKLAANSHQSLNVFELEFVKRNTVKEFVTDVVNSTDDCWIANCQCDSYYLFDTIPESIVNQQNKFARKFINARLTENFSEPENRSIKKEINWIKHLRAEPLFFVKKAAFDWSEILKPLKQFSDSAIYSDPFVAKISKPELKAFLDNLLPSSLVRTFHLTFVTESNVFNESKFKLYILEVIDELNRPYQVELTILLHPKSSNWHDRKLISNYFNLTFGKGLGFVANGKVKADSEVFVIGNVFAFNSVRSWLIKVNELISLNNGNSSVMPYGNGVNRLLELVAKAPGIA